MFDIGDKVFYPMHGAGVIQGIEMKEIQGHMVEYCAISIPIMNLNIMLPRANLAKVGIRSVVDLQTARTIMKNFHHEQPLGELPWKERYKRNMELLKSGEMQNSAQVVQDLLYRQKEKPLNSTEKQLLSDAHKALVSEISIIKDISTEQADELLKAE
ncbi:CarD family transcriptional regulator [Lederbergia galactosidilytica]|uniref:Transcription factor YdeB n=1 Tax=Lederbergia galactosidilytica TaxID=217031 RepID=A0A0Q9XTJ5_9BACI|nr:CarD family transcriptional regulator [Lederbergia galactosidilytica]KRG11599.1 transcription factor YdeB [Lederbergia galactosidilytica]KRG15163.1 transcription factor YdeB [Virgibacillus soli]MBP1913191.1 CarD family transcriptional regulator [Lederbergia galactosidilytica]OAK67872.1 transcription factor YdeB [Lederbergia galactosidilytica]